MITHCESMLYDICIKKPEGYYDITWGFDGWVICTPKSRHTYTPTTGWARQELSSSPLRGLMGAVTREQARQKMIDVWKCETERG